VFAQLAWLGSTGAIPCALIGVVSTVVMTVAIASDVATDRKGSAMQLLSD
jgi:hypothetical protein